MKARSFHISTAARAKVDKTSALWHVVSAWLRKVKVHEPALLWRTALI